MMEWTTWHGESASPMLANNQTVQVRYRTGQTEITTVNTLNWLHNTAAPHPCDIVAYRVVLSKAPHTLASSVDDMLAERGKRYGEFMGHALITQTLKEEFRAEDNWNIMKPDQRECLDMIAHKIGRILNGDPHYYDSWKDIAGYAKLVSDRLEKKHGT